MLALSLTVIVYEPAFTDVTFFPPFASVIVKPGPTVPASGVAAGAASDGAASARLATASAAVATSE